MLVEIINNTFLKNNLDYAIFIKNFSTGESISINTDLIVPSASIIKLFIMGAAFQSIEETLFTLHQRISIKEKDKIPYSIISLLETDHTYSIQDLIILMIIQSDNTATNLLISLLGMDYINSFINKQGMKHTILRRKMMDLTATENGYENYTTVSDVSEFLNLLYEGKVVNSYFSKNMVDIMSKQLDDSMMKREIPSKINIAHKTGDLPGIKHDTGIVYSSAGDYIFTMFTWNEKDDISGRKLIGKLSKSVYDFFLNKYESRF